MDFSFRNLKKFVSENFTFEENQISSESNLYNKQDNHNISTENTIVKNRNIPKNTSKLSYDVLLYIFEIINSRADRKHDLINCIQVCKLWSYIISGIIWRDITLKNNTLNISWILGISKRRERIQNTLDSDKYIQTGKYTSAFGIRIPIFQINEIIPSIINYSKNSDLFKKNIPLINYIELIRTLILSSSYNKYFEDNKLLSPACTIFNDVDDFDKKSNDKKSNKNNANLKSHINLYLNSGPDARKKLEYEFMKLKTEYEYDTSQDEAESKVIKECSSTIRSVILQSEFISPSLAKTLIKYLKNIKSLNIVDCVVENNGFIHKLSSGIKYSLEELSASLKNYGSYMRYPINPNELLYEINNFKSLKRLHLSNFLEHDVFTNIMKKLKFDLENGSNSFNNHSNNNETNSRFGVGDRNTLRANFLRYQTLHSTARAESTSQTYSNNNTSNGLLNDKDYLFIEDNYLPNIEELELICYRRIEHEKSNLFLLSNLLSSKTLNYLSIKPLQGGTMYNSLANFLIKASHLKYLSFYIANPDITEDIEVQGGIPENRRLSSVFDRSLFINRRLSIASSIDNSPLSPVSSSPSFNRSIISELEIIGSYSSLSLKKLELEWEEFGEDFSSFEKCIMDINMRVERRKQRLQQYIDQPSDKYSFSLKSIKLSKPYGIRSLVLHSLTVYNSEKLFKLLNLIPTLSSLSVLPKYEDIEKKVLSESVNQLLNSFSYSFVNETSKYFEQWVDSSDVGKRQMDLELHQHNHDDHSINYINLKTIFLGISFILPEDLKIIAQSCPKLKELHLFRTGSFNYDDKYYTVWELFKKQIKQEVLNTENTSSTLSFSESSKDDKYLLNFCRINESSLHIYLNSEKIFNWIREQPLSHFIYEGLGL
ncbi:hypothetical protein BCR32DRAFT_268869 [Anaeromyces robustus]|uniref:F-box domain-containing protein n=1 Tax=Anaeromyces robustus TaxID=1754192 RepID=A0A1Y1X3Q0_9FUNG|nr:hypothetical protein BCR32DRAFT_268869 [Anaeromyces robustus]|eukprot:ORX80437.1 hypothetical protein BCR32DRAFT_268869 [Anaeromyces robustus]